jgi:polysaccharide deacetylase family protein (PEP-CTERM system associated)
MSNALSIDVEDYFHVSAFERSVKKEEWINFPLRVEDNTRRMIDILSQYGIKATFFILGWVAERRPRLIRKIHEEGHEIACHGYGHRRVYTQSRQEFRDDIRKCKTLLEELIGAPVFGYRAPSYSISLNSLWAFDELAEAGFLYDSSVFPICHDLYGIPNWPRFPFRVAKMGSGKWAPDRRKHERGSGREKYSRMMELPITTLQLAGKNFPIAGGGYFRLFPYPFTRWALRRINQYEKRPFIFYLHPWELDPEQPRIPDVSFKSRFRHYVNLEKTEQRFRKLLTDFRFSPMGRLIDDPGEGRSEQEIAKSYGFVT